MNVVGPQAPRGRRIAVGLGEIAAAEQDDLLVVYGIGSCVAVIIADRELPIAALAHVVLPDSGGAPLLASQPARYADTAVPEVRRRIVALGARATHLGAILVGGASLFGLSGEIGRQNVAAVEAALRAERIPVLQQEVGGTNGRTLQFRPSTRQLSIQVRSLGAGITF